MPDIQAFINCTSLPFLYLRKWKRWQLYTTFPGGLLFLVIVCLGPVLPFPANQLVLADRKFYICYTCHFMDLIKKQVHLWNCLYRFLNWIQILKLRQIFGGIKTVFKIDGSKCAYWLASINTSFNSFPFSHASYFFFFLVTAQYLTWTCSNFTSWYSWTTLFFFL